MYGVWGGAAGKKLEEEKKQDQEEQESRPNSARKMRWGISYTRSSTSSK